MKQFKLEVAEINESALTFNSTLSHSDIGKFGVRDSGFKRVIVVCETEAQAADIINFTY